MINKNILFTAALIILVLIIVSSVTSLDPEQGILGEWTTKMTTLGIDTEDDESNVDETSWVLTFNENMQGTEVIKSPSHEDDIRTFTYSINATVLSLEFDDGKTESFDFNLEKDTMVLVKHNSKIEAVFSRI